MAKGPRQGKGPQRRPRKPVRRAGSSSTGRRTQTASSATGQGRGRTFSINTAKNATALVSKARKVAKENGATFRGDTTSGSFSGKGVEGKYKVEGSTVRITITDKPTLASWSTVESRVKEFFR